MTARAQIEAIYHALRRAGVSRADACERLGLKYRRGFDLDVESDARLATLRRAGGVDRRSPVEHPCTISAR